MYKIHIDPVGDKGYVGIVKDNKGNEVARTEVHTLIVVARRVELLRDQCAIENTDLKFSSHLELADWVKGVTGCDFCDTHSEDGALHLDFFKAEQHYFTLAIDSGKHKMASNRVAFKPGNGEYISLGPQAKLTPQDVIEGLQHSIEVMRSIQRIERSNFTYAVFEQELVETFEDSVGPQEMPRSKYESYGADNPVEPFLRVNHPRPNAFFYLHGYMCKRREMCGGDRVLFRIVDPEGSIKVIVGSDDLIEGAIEHEVFEDTTWLISWDDLKTYHMGKEAEPMPWIQTFVDRESNARRQQG